MTLFLITFDKQDRLEIDFLPSAVDIHQWLGCDYFEIIQRFIHGKRFDFIVDDRARIKGLVMNALASDHAETLCGNILITAHTEGGEWETLTDDDVALIKNAITSDGLLVYEKNEGGTK